MNRGFQLRIKRGYVFRWGKLTPLHRRGTPLNSARCRNGMMSQPSGSSSLLVKTDATAPLSKNAQKRLLKAGRLAATKADRRAKERAARKAKKAERREAGEDDPDGLAAKKARRKYAPPSEKYGSRVVVDLRWDDRMTDKVGPSGAPNWDKEMKILKQRLSQYTGNHVARLSDCTLLFEQSMCPSPGRAHVHLFWRQTGRTVPHRRWRSAHTLERCQILDGGLRGPLRAVRDVYICFHCP
jgi:hypothetical protein